MSLEQLRKSCEFQPGLPLSDAVFADEAYSQEAMDAQLRRVHDQEPAFGGLLEIVVEPTRRLYLFLVQRELHAAAVWRNGEFAPLTLRRFFQFSNAAFGAKMTLWRVEPILLKSLLVLTQKTPSLQTTSAVVKLDGLLQHLEQMRRDALLSVQEGSGLTLCYFLNGRLVYLESTNPAWQGLNDGAETVLSKIVQATAAADPVPLSLYEDVNVRPASDRDLLGDQWPEKLADVFLMPRFGLVLSADGGQEARVLIKGSRFTIGRGSDNDLVLSDPSVSRVHLLVLVEQGRVVAQDLDSRNGTMVNGRAITSQPLDGGESVRVGDVALRFIKQEDDLIADEAGQESGDTTVVRAVQPPASYQKTGMLGWLDVISGKLSGMRFELTRTKVLIGRNQGDVVIDDPKISREHGSIEWTPDGFLYVDLGSTNGSAVNHLPVNSQLLKSGDVLRLGDTELQLHAGDES
jgi:pSer/pThr/pTyr-binding forkhead associated (FHA) protein